VEDQIPPGLPVWLQVILVVFGTLAALLAGIRAIPPLWHFVEQFVQAVHFLTVLPSVIEDQNRKIEDIHHETHPNSGGSIKDAVNRIEAAQSDIRDAQGKTDTKVNRLVRSQAAFRTETKNRLDKIEHERQ